MLTVFDFSPNHLTASEILLRLLLEGLVLTPFFPLLGCLFQRKVHFFSGWRDNVAQRKQSLEN